MRNTSRKLFEIASHLNELNKDGKVKGFKGNEKGYAKVIEICRGCSVWVHHEKSDDLIIDLLVSPSANENNPTLCGNAIQKFKEFFDFSSKISKWNHSIDTHRDHKRYYVVVTEKSKTEIVDVVEKLKQNLA